MADSEKKSRRAASLKVPDYKLFAATGEAETVSRKPPSVGVFRPLSPGVAWSLSRNN